VKKIGEFSLALITPIKIIEGLIKAVSPVRSASCGVYVLSRVAHVAINIYFQSLS